MAKYDMPANDTVTGEWLALMFQAFDLNDPAASIGNALRDDLGGNAVQYVMNGSAEAVTPRRVYAKVRDKVLVVIQCTENNRSAIGLWNGWQGDPATNPTQVTNGHIEAAAQSIYAELLQQGYHTPNMFITGHSQGGAIANVLGRLLFFDRQVTNLKVTTFGAPKSGGSGTYTGLNGDRLCRWMTVEDPVPLLPPASALASTMGALGDARSARRMTQFTQPGGGRLLSDLPTEITAGVIPPAATLPAISNFVGWLLGVERLSVPHRIRTYRERLGDYNNRHPRPNQQRPTGGQAQQANPATAREVTQQERVWTQTMFNAGRAQQVEVRQEVKATMFAAFRQGRIWSVWLNGQQVAVGPTKKRARALARIGNSFLRRMQRFAFIDQATLLAQVGAVISQMADPASGFRPPLRVEMPVPQ